MQPNTSSRKNNDLRNLALVILTSICAAFLLTFFFVYQYGPSGQYVAKNVLLDPAILGKLNYNDTDPKTGGVSRFIFDSLEFTWYDDATKAWKKIDVNAEKYARFYNQFAGEISIKNPSDEIVNLFNSSTSAKLILRVKTESSAKWQAATKIFQETQIVNNGNYYRVELHEQATGEHWAYFYHPHMYQEVFSIMVPKL